MTLAIIKMLALTILQNASFTMVSRARNSQSIVYHAYAAMVSNTVWILVIRHVIVNFENTELMVAYVIGSVTGSIGMHHLAMKYFEKKKPNEHRNQ